MITPHSVIRWSDSLLVGVDFIDHDHQDAVEAMNHLAALSATEPGSEALRAAFAAFRTHCEEHFAREEAMMVAVDFFALAPHQGEHQRVLAELGAVAADLAAGRDRHDYFAEALPQWFLEHRATMDYVTADFARSRGFVSAP